MTAPAPGMRAAQARNALDAAVREQLRQAWERGHEAASAPAPVVDDAGVDSALGAIGRATDDYAAAVVAMWRQP